MSATGRHSIAGLAVEGLFGLYNYRLGSYAGQPFDPRLLLLYGDNGCGKTTILRLVYHCLSPESNRAHRTELTRIPVRRFSVELVDGTEVEIERAADTLTGAYRWSLSRPKKSKRVLDVVPNAEGRVTRRARCRSRAQSRRARSRPPALRERRHQLHRRARRRAHTATERPVPRRERHECLDGSGRAPPRTRWGPIGLAVWAELSASDCSVASWSQPRGGIRKLACAFDGVLLSPSRSGRSARIDGERGASSRPRRSIQLKFTLASSRFGSQRPFRRSANARSAGLT